MKILELTTSFLGTSIFIMNKANALKAKGVEISILGPVERDGPGWRQIHGIDTFQLRYFFENWERLTGGSGIPENVKRSFLARIQVPFLVANFYRFARQFGKDYDIIHANWSFAGIAGMLAAGALGKPFVLTMHGAEVFTLGYHPVIALLLKRTPTLVVNSSYTLNTIRSKYQLNDIETHIIPFGANYEFGNTYDYQREEFFREELGISSDSKVLFSLGRLVERKGHIYLLEAFHRLSERHPELHLVIGGKGPEQAKLDDYIRNHNVPRVHFIEFIPEEKLPYYYANAFVFVLPAIIDSDGDTEGLGVVNIEAMSYGTPVISTNAGGIVDVVKPDRTGILVEQKDPEALAGAVDRLLNDETLRRRLAEQGREYVRNHFSWDAIAEEYAELYSRIKQHNGN